ncbi:MAG: hypothetical protein AAGI30_08585 [Planctomycetota bacterium]
MANSTPPTARRRLFLAFAWIMVTGIVLVQMSEFFGAFEETKDALWLLHQFIRVFICVALPASVLVAAQLTTTSERSE